MNINIRLEKESDYKKVENICREAFFNLYIEGCTEHYVVHTIRNSNNFIKDLSCIIEVDGEIAGGCFYTKSKIINKTGVQFSSITFGPVFIDPKYHRKGLGRKLITHTINKAKKLGYERLIICGYPYHYKTYGFVSAKKYDISTADGEFYIGTQALELKENAFNGVSGAVHFCEEYETNEEKALLFDEGFCYKEKKKTKSQEEFSTTALLLDLNSY